MPTTTPTFRIFVSSTFEDLKEERNALQREVFPGLRELCLSHGCRFQAVDLRWGVRDEAALDQRMMDVCLTEIERCERTGIKPNFIVLLGDRYGPQILPARIEAQEFKRVSAKVPDEDLRLIEEWYRLDDNAVPSEYLLLPRKGEYVDKTRWDAVARQLIRTLCDGARDANLSESELIKYKASATHQEVLKGLGTTSEDRKHVFVFCRSSNEADRDQRLRDFDRFLCDELDENVFRFVRGDLGELCKHVRTNLTKVILSQISAFESRSELDLEVKAHNDFARDRSQHFFGREDELRRIAEYLDSDQSTPIVLKGASGSGKSAVMANASAIAAERMRNSVVIRRFIGATPESSAGMTLFRSLCQEISGEYGLTDDPPERFNELVKTFRNRLTLATAARPLAIFIDALDQLDEDDPASPVDWLPLELPPNAKIVVSTVDTPAALLGNPSVDLLPMAILEADLSLASQLKQAGRTLQDGQHRKILEFFDRSPMPLYLKLAFEEARHWRSFDRTEECQLGESLGGIVGALFDRLSEQSNHGPALVEASLGYLAASRYGLTEDEMLDLLSDDRDVLLDFSKRKHHDPPDQRLPIAIWSRFYFDLEPYLVERAAPGGTVIAFYHRQMAEHASARYLAGGRDQSRHSKLASYYAAQPNWLDSESKVPNGRKVAEEPFQQLRAGLRSTMNNVLTDLQFVAAKFAAGLRYDLLEDYRAALSSQEFPSELRTPTVEFLRFARSQAHILTRYPNAVLQRALFEPEASGPITQARKMLLTQNKQHMWVEWLNKPKYPPACVLTIDSTCRTFNTQHRLGRLTFSPDGKLLLWGGQDGSLRIWGADTGFERIVWQERSVLVRSCAFWPNGDSILSSWDDGTVMLQSLEGGRPLWSFNLEGPVSVCAVSPGGDKIALAHGNVASIWDAASLEKLTEPKVPFGKISVCEFSPDGKAVLICGHKLGEWCWMQLVDANSGANLGSLMFMTFYINDARFSPDGTKVELSCGRLDSRGNLFIVDVASAPKLTVIGKLAHTELPNVGDVIAGAFSADGSVVVCSYENKLVICDGTSASPLAEFRAHDRVSDCAVSSGGDLLASGSNEGEIKLWSLQAILEEKRHAFHRQAVTSCDFSSDSDFLITSSDDGSVKIWDARTFSERSTIGGDIPDDAWFESTADGAIPAGRIKFTEPPAVLACAVSHDGTGIALGYAVKGFSRHDSLAVIEIKYPDSPVRLHGHTEDVNSCAFSPDNSVIVSASKDTTIRLWNTITGTELMRLAGHTDAVNSCAFSPDGSVVASGSDDRTVRLWQITQGDESIVLEGHEGSVSTCKFSPSGSLLLSASEDCTLRLWDPTQKQPLAILKGHEGFVTGCDFSPHDGVWIASVGTDNSLRIWETATGKEVLSVWMDGARTIKWQPDGFAIVVGDEAGKIHFLSFLHPDAAEVARGKPPAPGRNGIEGNLRQDFGWARSQATQRDTPPPAPDMVEYSKWEEERNLRREREWVQYEAELSHWRSLPFLKRLRTPRPKKPY